MWFKTLPLFDCADNSPRNSIFWAMDSDFQLKRPGEPLVSSETYYSIVSFVLAYDADRDQILVFTAKIQQIFFQRSYKKRPKGVSRANCPFINFSAAQRIHTSSKSNDTA
jgi:hypothetical protein